MNNQVFIVYIGDAKESGALEHVVALLPGQIDHTDVSVVKLTKGDESLTIETSNSDGGITSTKYCFDRKTGELKKSPFMRSARLMRDLHGD